MGQRIRPKLDPLWVASSGDDYISTADTDKTEDMFQVTSPSGIIIDVGWYRTVYCGMVVRNGHKPGSWDDPAEEFSSIDAMQMVAWVERMGEKYK